MSASWSVGKVIFLGTPTPEAVYLVQEKLLYFRWYRLDLQLWMTGTDEQFDSYLIPGNINQFEFSNS